MTAMGWAVVVGGGLVGVAGVLIPALAVLRYFTCERRVHAPESHSPPSSPLWAGTPAAGAQMQRVMQRAFAGGETQGLVVHPGTVDGVRELLDGMADTLLNEAASAQVRGERRIAGMLVMLEDQVRDARDSLRD